MRTASRLRARCSARRLRLAEDDLDRQLVRVLRRDGRDASRLAEIIHREPERVDLRLRATDEDVLDETIEQVTCRWCGPSGAVEQLPPVVAASDGDPR